MGTLCVNLLMIQAISEFLYVAQGGGGAGFDTGAGTLGVPPNFVTILTHTMEWIMKCS